MTETVLIFGFVQRLEIRIQHLVNVIATLSSVARIDGLRDQLMDDKTNARRPRLAVFVNSLDSIGMRGNRL